LYPNKLKGERWDSNPRMPEPQSGVLTPSPLSPYMAGIVGIEPTPTVLETVVLPLNYIPIIKKWKGVDSTHRTRSSGFTVRRVSPDFATLPKWWRGTESNGRTQ